MGAEKVQVTKYIYSIYVRCVRSFTQVSNIVKAQGSFSRKFLTSKVNFSLEKTIMVVTKMISGLKLIVTLIFF